MREICLESYLCPRCFSEIRARSRVDSPARKASAKKASNSGSCPFLSGSHCEVNSPLAITWNFQLDFSQTEKVDSARPISVPVVVMTLVQPRVPIAAQKLVALPFQ